MSVKAAGELSSTGKYKPRRWLAALLCVIACAFVLRIAFRRNHLIQVRWLARRDHVYGALCLSGGTLCAIDMPDRINTIRAADGAELSAFTPQPPGTDISYFLAVIGGRVLTADSERIALVDLERKGTVWSRHVSHGSICVYAQNSSKLVILGPDSMALDAKTGTRIWRTSVLSSDLSAAAVGGNVVVVATNQGRVIGLSLVTGKALWSIRADTSYLWADEGMVYALCAKGGALGLRPADGKVLWDRTGEAGYPAQLEIGAEDKSELYGVNYNVLVKVSKTNGQVKWSTALGSHNASTPLWIRGLLFVPSGYADLYLVNPENGDVVDELDLARISDKLSIINQYGTGIDAVLSADGRYVYITTTFGLICCLSVNNR